MKQATARAIESFIEYLVEPYKAAGALAAGGLDLLIHPGDIATVTEHRTALVIVLGILAALDAIGYFTRPAYDAVCDPCDTCREILDDAHGAPALLAAEPIEVDLGNGIGFEPVSSPEQATGQMLAAAPSKETYL